VNSMGTQIAGGTKGTRIVLSPIPLDNPPTTDSPVATDTMLHTPTAIPKGTTPTVPMMSHVVQPISAPTAALAPMEPIPGRTRCVDVPTAMAMKSPIQSRLRARMTFGLRAIAKDIRHSIQQLTALTAKIIVVFNEVIASQ
jgi:hypothetical protein